MTKHTDNSGQSRPANTVEEAWTQTFESYGVNPKQADLITKTVLGHSDISKGNPSGAEIRDIVEQHVSDVDYTYRLDDPNDEERVQEELLDALEDAIDGIEGGQLIEDDPHPVGGFNPCREDDDPVAVVARVLDAIDFELLGEELSEGLLDPLFVLGRITEGAEINIVKRDSRHTRPSRAARKRALIRREEARCSSNTES